MPSERGDIMAQLASFDIVSKFDEQELKNALDQARREIHQRYDLKDTKTEIDHTDSEITINTDSEFTLQAVRGVMEDKFVKRHLSLKILDYGNEEPASGGRIRQHIKLKQGIPDELGKQIAKRIRDEFKKVTPQIQGDTVRVQAKSKDELQHVIQALKQDDYPVALQFVNYR
jgi:cyclic-di-GMP-binding protein